MSDIFYVLADATRRDILTALLGSGAVASVEKSVSDLVEELSVNQPTVSKHLKIMRDADVVRVREEGAFRFYKLNIEPFNEAEDFLLRFLANGIDTEISVEYITEDSYKNRDVYQVCNKCGELHAAAKDSVVGDKTLHAAESVGRVAAKATVPVKELVARIKLRG
ncbi:winged helix-turn-helix domain-containing protein [Canibacter sp. lx-72]|nr:metalloregulator ArsR/SmtB family transcription factor [Canibacter zhuwentaonis]MBT1018552.1 winged helix-turn-helix domain-containing protein [Canibacter zhuwentaonis]MBT1035747.1 winged helix-turn-helix domain-containing protein [Canibacter zhuwentaonis]